MARLRQRIRITFAHGQLRQRFQRPRHIWAKAQRLLPLILSLPQLPQLSHSQTQLVMAGGAIRIRLKCGLEQGDRLIGLSPAQYNLTLRDQAVGVVGIGL